MRKIKFRGYSKERQRWVYGYYYGGLRWADFIIEDAGFENRVQVDPSTVGQFTGLLDKNGKEIYEGDIVKCIFNYTEWSGYVAFIKGDFVLIDSDKNGQYLTLSVLSDVEIIGNIHDNSELIK